MALIERELQINHGVNYLTEDEKLESRKAIKCVVSVVNSTLVFVSKKILNEYLCQAELVWQLIQKENSHTRRTVAGCGEEFCSSSHILSSLYCERLELTFIDCSLQDSDMAFSFAGCLSTKDRNEGNSLVFPNYHVKIILPECYNNKTLICLQSQSCTVKQLFSKMELNSIEHVQ